MMFLKAFVVGGLICVVGQLLIDLTKLTPARILVSFVCLGVLLGAFGGGERLDERLVLLARERRVHVIAAALAVAVGHERVRIVDALRRNDGRGGVVKA